MNYTKTEYEWGYMIWYLDGINKDGLDMSTARMVMRPNSKSQEHYHSNCYEQLMVVAGELKLVVNDETVNLNNEETFLIDPNMRHYLMNTGSDDVEIVIVYSSRTRDYSIPD